MNIAALIIGGLVGTLLRYFMGQWMPNLHNGFPIGIMLINFIGCFFLGWLFTVSTGLWHIHQEIRLGLGTGMTGAFTTFSTFTVQSVWLMEHGSQLIAISYILMSILGGIVLTITGVRIANIQLNRKNEVSS
ncbi:MAG: hypothetical protein A2189_04505 [Paenibacillus sp. RIFOXYA1_FULL_44_5]|nr:MAG: hypothetical protein A2189_04505 [Paenibacillus sp. RIFOXYA1_FULL_44_5]